jgi:pyruvate dehydrogenase E2 component (dihydrolipoamide acetyltransferase)
LNKIYFSTINSKNITMAEAIRLGRMTDTMEEGFISELYIKVGDVIKVGDTIADVETDKATLPLESYYKGEILFISAKKGEPLAIGGLVAIIGKKGEDFQHLLTEVAAPKSEPIAKVEEVKDSHIANVETIITTTTNSDARLKASPLAKSIAKEKGIDLSSIQGSGEDGRIVKRDIEKVKVATTAASIPVVNGQEGFSDVSVSQMRKTIAKRLSESMFTAPHFYLNMSINMDKAVAFRKELNEALETKISFNDLVLKAVAMSLRENPDVNTSWLGDKIRKYQHIHLGMAVAVDEGLVVPVIKFADQKSLRNLSTEAKALAQKAVAKKLSPAEMDGSTFTISNLGMFGIESFTAIINQPNACILAVGAIQQEPVVKDGKIEVGHIMKVSLSSDHRVVDGAVGSKFLISLKKYLESPLLMLI